MWISSNTIDENKMTSYFCSDNVFNLSNSILTDDEIKALRKSLDFAPIEGNKNES